MELRPYQKEAKTAVLSQWEQGNSKTLLVLPTGCGKTIVFAKIAEDRVRNGERVLILAHRGELLEQAADKILNACGLGCAVEKAEESCIGSWYRITVGSVQSLMREKRLAQFSKDYLVTVDREGPSVALIAKYFQQFLDEDVEVRIEPIYRISGFERVQKSDFVSSVAISLNLTSQERRFYNESTEEKGNFTQCTQRIADLTRDDFGSNFMTLSFGLGKRSKKSMTKDAVLDLIYKLRLDSDMIREIAVKCKKDSEEKIEVAKLKESQFDLSLNISGDGMDYILAHADDFFDARRKDYNQRVNELRAICRKEEVVEYFKENKLAFA